MDQIKVTVWNEYVHELESKEIAKIYPEGIHGCIAQFLNNAGFDAKTATLSMPEHGLTQEVIDNTDVLIWWGHIAHEKVSDAIVTRVHNAVLDGMGLIVLHSGHASKIFQKIVGTRTDRLRWREADEKEILWPVAPGHEILKGIGENIVLPQEETYGEFFHITPPDELVFISWFEGGEVFRSGCCYRREKGKIFYFKPGHEAYPIYYNPEIQKVIINAVGWARRTRSPEIIYGNTAAPKDA